MNITKLRYYANSVLSEKDKPYQFNSQLALSDLKKKGIEPTKEFIDSIDDDLSQKYERDIRMLPVIIPSFTSIKDVPVQLLVDGSLVNINGSVKCFFNGKF